MKVLVTGATGLVGTAFTAVCLENNIDVNYLTTRKDKLTSINGAQGFYWNPSSKDIDIECFEGVNAIVNLAGASIAKRWTKKYKEEIRTSRVASLATLRKGLEKIDVSEIKSIVSASATGIYPTSLSDYYTEQTHEVDDSFLGSVVKEWEQEIDNLANFKINIAKIRIGLVLSCKGGALPSIAKPVKNYVGAAFGTGEQWQSWIHVEDLARLFLFAVQNKLDG
ncbi:MAG: NAD-dependent epimerase/dehydratase family protein, partial [Muriicola sp.]|nr:NAD-dependent epimerase/dehydratase family protein [Muriicola sp.]